MENQLTKFAKLIVEVRGYAPANASNIETLPIEFTSTLGALEVRGLSKAALWLQLKSFAFNPCAPRPTGRTRFSSLDRILNFADAKFLEVRGFEPLTFSLRTRR